VVWRLPKQRARLPSLNRMTPMSEENTTEAAPQRGGKKMVLVAVLVVGALLGGGAGAVFAGPMLADMILGPADAAAAGAHGAEGEHGEEAEGGHGGGHGAGAANYLVENLVLNPAQSGGTRFLMASVSLDLKEPAVAEEMKARDAQVRDALLTVLGHKTVQELTDIAGRDSLKVELQSAVSALFPEGTVRGIYLPQFVIQ
jgi:flagellar protein FliL